MQRRNRGEPPLGDKHTQALVKELGGKTPPPLDALTPAEIGTLAELLRSARHNQQQQLNHAFEAALGHIPLLLRGPIRKIFSA
jgi:hypothetical protein